MGRFPLSLARTTMAAVAASTLLLLVACGGGSGSGGDGGGGGGGSGSGMTAPSGLSYAGNPFKFVVGQAITALNPTVSGTVTSYQANLPAGLQINATTGVISGTPTQIAAATNYQVSAGNSVGQTTATLSITVNNTAPAISYKSPKITFTTGVASLVPPSNSGGAVVSWSVTPALPAGLTLNTTDGTISGTPIAAAAATSYVVTAQNLGGPSTFNLTLAVAAVPLLQLGHTEGIQNLKSDGQHVLSQGGNHWVLWNFTSGAVLAQGDANCNSCIETFPGYGTYPSDLAGSTFVIVTGTGLEVHSTTDGHVLSTITTPAVSWWKLASDGSYVVGGSNAGLYVWSPTGQLLLSHAGDYSKALVFGSSTAVLVALGAAGNNVIETVPVGTGAASVSGTFQGNFVTWFLDGGSFITSTGNVVWIYSNGVVQRDMTTLASYAADGSTTLGGEGNWFWSSSINNGNVLKVFTVGSSTSPTASYSLGNHQPVVSGTTIGLIPDGGLTVVDLSGSSPAVATRATPLNYQTAYVAVSSSQYLVGNAYGVLLDASNLPTARYLGYGEVLSIAGSASRVALATASGNVLYFDAATNALQGTINFPASKIALSADGSMLAAVASPISPMQNSSGLGVAVYSLPSTTPIYSQPISSADAFYVSLGGSGSTLMLGLTSLSGPRSVVSLATGNVVWSDNGGLQGTANPDPVFLSPDGTLIAASDGPQEGGTSTKIYKNGTLATAVNGFSLGWVDNSRVLVNNFSVRGITVSYLGCSTYDATGTATTCGLPQLQSFQPVTSGTLYSPEKNAIFALSDGTLAWMSGSPSSGAGAIAGGSVVFTSGAMVLAEPY